MGKVDTANGEFEADHAEKLQSLDEKLAAMTDFLQTIHDTRRERRAVKENTLGTNEKTVAMGNRWASRARKNLHFQRNAYVPPPAASKHSCLFEPGGGRSKVGFSLASSL